LKEDEIWQAVEQVWKELPNSKIASGYIQAYQIAQKVIASGGDNKFLGASNCGGMHVGVRNDFEATLLGLKRKDGRTIPPPARSKEAIVILEDAQSKEATVMLEAAQ